MARGQSDHAQGPRVTIRAGFCRRRDAGHISSDQGAGAVLSPQFLAQDRSARPSINPPTIMPMISSNAMAHMGFLREGSPPLHYIGHAPRGAASDSRRGEAWRVRRVPPADCETGVGRGAGRKFSRVLNFTGPSPYTVALPKLDPWSPIEGLWLALGSPPMSLGALGLVVEGGEGARPWASVLEWQRRLR